MNDIQIQDVSKSLNNCNSCRFIGNHIPLEDAKSHLQIITVSDTEAGKHWCDNEVRALINIWSDEKIKQMLEGAKRKKKKEGKEKNSHPTENRKTNPIIRVS